MSKELLPNRIVLRLYLLMMTRTKLYLKGPYLLTAKSRSNQLKIKSISEKGKASNKADNWQGECERSDI